jgi:hypothetical protein
MTTTLYPSLAARLEANSIPAANGCRNWTGNTNNSGYSRYSVRCGHQVKKVYAHRSAWEIEHGRAIPAGFEIDHKCSNTLCIEADHLELVTGTENLRRRDARRAARTTH